MSDGPAWIKLSVSLFDVNFFFNITKNNYKRKLFNIDIKKLVSKLFFKRSGDLRKCAINGILDNIYIF